MVVKTAKFGPIQEEELLDSAVTNVKVASGEIVFGKLAQDHGIESAVPDVDTEIAHDLGVIPTDIQLTQQSTGVEGYVMESARSATSITVRANVSGVNLKWSAVE